MTVFEAQQDGKVLEIVCDTCPENPREWDHLGTMVYGHRRYCLGDEKAWNTDYYENWNDWLEGEIVKPNGGWDNVIALPLYFYDHSVQSISTVSFAGRAHHAEWDSGQVGWIYVTTEKVRKEFGVKRVTQKLREKVIEMLRSEVETFDHYIQGNVFGFIASKIMRCNECNHEEKETVDSCLGFYGDDWRKNGLIDHLPEEFVPLLEELEFVA